MGRRACAFATLLVSLALADPLQAQTGGAPEVGFASIPFQFFPPGARSLAMGATFIGVADDATAAASNPAGLIILTKPEASFHGRLTHFSETAAGGYTTPSVSQWSASYASLVVPKKPFSFSAYYQEVSRIDLERSFAGLLSAPGDPQPSSIASTSRVDMLLSDVGLSGAVRVGDKLSLGATVGRRKMRLAYLAENTITGDLSFFDSASADASDTATVFSAGALVNPAGRLSGGLVFKRGGSFAIPYVVNFEGAINGPVSCPRAATCEAGAIQIPDTWGVGFGFRPTNNWLFSADASLIRYSQLSTTVFRRVPFDIYPPVTNELPPSEFKDVVQLNAGAERIFAGKTTVLVRAGVYHRPNFNDASGVDSGATFATGGVGLVFGDRGQLDFAASVSGSIAEGLASLVIRF